MNDTHCPSLYLQSLSRLTRVVPAVFLAVMDTCGPAAILEGMGAAGARVQQHLLTAIATALLTSRIHTHRMAQSKVGLHSEVYVDDSKEYFVSNSYTDDIGTCSNKPRHTQTLCFKVVFYFIATTIFDRRFRRKHRCWVQFDL